MKMMIYTTVNTERSVEKQAQEYPGHMHPAESPSSRTSKRFTAECVTNILSMTIPIRISARIFNFVGVVGFVACFEYFLADSVLSCPILILPDFYGQDYVRYG